MKPVRGEICVKSGGSTGLLLTSNYLSLGLIFAFIVHFPLTDLCRIVFSHPNPLSVLNDKSQKLDVFIVS
jgi:hypothetical protein